LQHFINGAKNLPRPKFGARFLSLVPTALVFWSFLVVNAASNASSVNTSSRVELSSSSFALSSSSLIYGSQDSLGLELSSSGIVSSSSGMLSSSSQVKIKRPKKPIAPPTLSELQGRFNPADYEEFVTVPKVWTSGGRPMWLRKAAAKAFVQMALAARADGIELRVVSALRTFQQQKAIWDAKWNGRTSGYEHFPTLDPITRAKGVLAFSSIPGTSRHHWGTDIDINSVEPDHFKQGRGLKVYQWLQKNGAKYGFCQTYAGKSQGRLGYEDEAWHWSYMPLSADFLKRYLAFVSHGKVLSGFAGAKVMDPQWVLREYVQGIAPQCLNWTSN
jgi:D-alanyl-D-alanine carboxypeptidase